MYIYTTIAALVAGYVLDLCIGDPHGMWHPICFVGNLISFFEKRLRRGRSERADLAGGVLLVILVTGISTAIPFGILFLCYRLWFWLGRSGSVYVLYGSGDEIAEDREYESGRGTGTGRSGSRTICSVHDRGQRYERTERRPVW